MHCRLGVALASVAHYCQTDRTGGRLPAAPRSMKTGYYGVLGVSRTASTDEIKRAFRKLALKHHPERTAGDPVQAETNFHAVCEAYEVLSHPARRAIFDQYGERGLKDGVPDGQGGIKGGIYRYSMNSQEVFANFFGTSSPFADLFGTMGGDVPEFYGDLTGMTLPKKPAKLPPMELSLPVTLAEVYNGATKKVIYTRRVLGSDNTTAEAEETIHISVVAGAADGTVSHFPAKGHEDVDTEPADVQVVMKTAPDPKWSREGDTLSFTADITLCEALTNTIVQVPTFDGRVLSVPVNQIVSPGVTKTVTGEGMPKASGGKGDLVVRFNVAFPETLTPAQKASIKKILLSS